MTSEPKDRAADLLGRKGEVSCPTKRYVTEILQVPLPSWNFLSCLLKRLPIPEEADYQGTYRQQGLLPPGQVRKETGRWQDEGHWVKL